MLRYAAQVILPQLLQPPVSLHVYQRYLMLSKARHLLLAHNEVHIDKKILDVTEYTIWAQIARLQLSYTRNVEMARDVAPQARLTSRMCQSLLVLITLVRSQQSDNAAVPLAWIKRAFERFADLLTEVRPFENEQDMYSATVWYLQRVLPLNSQPFRAEREPGTGKLVLRFVD